MKPEELLFAKSHEWCHVSTEGGQRIATVGITAFAVELLTDLVFLDLPKLGKATKAGTSFAEIESVKAVSDIYAPVDGEVLAVNAKLPDQLETLASDPYGAGWIAKIKIASDEGLKSLMNYNAYQKQCAEEH